MKLTKKCCFIGHREIEITDKLKREVSDYIEYLIINENVTEFLFGSRSQFNTFCHNLVTDLKQKYVFIKRIAYSCKSETVFFEYEKEKWMNIYNSQKFAEIPLFFDDEFRYEPLNFSGKASYIERNFKMIDDSDFCVFYYNKNYTIPQKYNKNKYFNSKINNSGTMIAFNYAQKKNKIIKNFCFN